jgi:hypothetical protein
LKEKKTESSTNGYSSMYINNQTKERESFSSLLPLFKSRFELKNKHEQQQQW